MQLERPVTAPVAFDFKSGRVPSIGCPLEHIKSGTLRGLIEYGAFYAARRRRPELVGANQNRLGLDEDFVAIFWTMLPSFCAVSKFVREFQAASEAEVSPLGVLQLAEFLVAGIAPSSKYIYRLPPADQIVLLEAAIESAARFQETAATWTADAGAEYVMPLIEDAIARLTEAAQQGFALAAAIKSGVTLLGAECEGAAEPDCLVDYPSLQRLPPTILPRRMLLPVDELTAYPSVWHAPYDVLAAQWTYVEHGMFRSIPLAEWLACGWDNPRYLHAADAIRRYIDRFNAVALWVTAEVLAPDTPSERAAAIVRFLKLSVVLRAYNNFTALAELSAGLRRDSVTRLAGTWALLPAAAQAQFASLVAAVEDKRNYKNYKDAMKALPPGVPAVPHLGPHTAELTMQDQLLPGEVAAPDGVSKFLHFRRLRELHKLTAPLLELQDAGYEVAHEVAAAVAAASPAGAGVGAAGGAGRSAAAASAAAMPMPMSADMARLHGAMAAHSPALLRLPPHNPSLANCLEALVRPFYFAFEEDRTRAVAALEARSFEIEPPQLAEEGDGDDGDGDGDRDGGGGDGAGAGAGVGAGAGAGGRDRRGLFQRSVKLVTHVTRMFSPTRGPGGGTDRDRVAGAGAGGAGSPRAGDGYEEEEEEGGGDGRY